MEEKKKTWLSPISSTGLTPPPVSPPQRTPDYARRMQNQQLGATYRQRERFTVAAAEVSKKKIKNEKKRIR